MRARDASHGGRVVSDVKPPVALRYKMSTIKQAYQAASDIHERAGQRHATMLVFAAWIIEIHSRMVPCSTDETLGIVRDYLRELKAVP